MWAPRTCNRDLFDMRKTTFAALTTTALKPGWEHELDGAYDPNDPTDKATVQALIDAAVKAAEDAHEAEVEGLKNKNKDLVERLRKARAGDTGADASEINRLERELEEVQGQLRTAQTEVRETKRQLTAAERDRDAARQTAETETNFSRSMVVENELTAALTEHKVAPQFFEAAKALLGKGAAVKEVDGKRSAFVGDKSLGDYVKEWSASDAGKAFVQAPGNTGGGTSGGASGGSQTGKKLADYTGLERTNLMRNNPAEWNKLVEEAGQPENKVPIRNAA